MNSERGAAGESFNVRGSYWRVPNRSDADSPFLKISLFEASLWLPRGE